MYSDKLTGLSINDTLFGEDQEQTERQDYVYINGNKEVFNQDLFNNLYELYRFVDNKFDGVFVIDGMERGGKSELAFQCALVLDEIVKREKHKKRRFKSKNVVYSKDEFAERVPRLGKYEVCVWDEFTLEGMSTEVVTKNQKEIIKYFTTIGKNNLFIILVCPSIFLMTKYFSMFRTRMLIHTKTIDIKRGYFDFYNYDGKWNLIVKGKKDWSYLKRYSYFSGNTKSSPWSQKYIDHNDIEKRKDFASGITKNENEGEKE